MAAGLASALAKVREHAGSTRNLAPGASGRLAVLDEAGGGFTLLSYLQPGVNGAGKRTRNHVLYCGADRLSRGTDPKIVADIFENRLMLDVAATSPQHALDHAGAVGWRGRAIVIPGSSYSGKSTLTAAFVRAGATYYSDEYAVFTEQGKLKPFPRPLQLRQPRGRPTKKVPAKELGGDIGVTQLPVGLIVETTYRAGAQWRPRHGTTGGGALALMAHAVPIQGRPGWTMSILSRAARQSEHLEGERGAATAVAERILNDYVSW